MTPRPDRHRRLQLGMRRIAAISTNGRSDVHSSSASPSRRCFPTATAQPPHLLRRVRRSSSDSEYVLNALTYGWWTNGTLYRFNDPDEVVLWPPRRRRAPRLHTAVIAGTVLLDGDDLTLPAMQRRALDLLTNPAVNALAKSGRSFRPVDAAHGGSAADIFVRNDGSVLYLAAFNFSASRPAMKQVDLSRLGLKSAVTYRARDLSRNGEDRVTGHLANTPRAGRVQIVAAIEGAWMSCGTGLADPGQR